MDDRRPPPGWLYAIGWSVLGIGMALGILRLLSLVSDFDLDVGGMPRAAMPGQLRLPAAAASDYTIYQESTSVVDGQSFLGGATPVSLSCTLTDPAGQPVALETHSFTHTNYSFPPYQGTSILTFHTDNAGTYELNCTTDPGDQQAVLAVGQSDSLSGAGAAFGTILLSIMIGVGIFLIQFFRRRSWFNRHRPAPPAYGPAPPYFPAPVQAAYGHPASRSRLQVNEFGRLIAVPSLVTIWLLTLVWMYTSG